MANMPRTMWGMSAKESSEGEESTLAYSEAWVSITLVSGEQTVFGKAATAHTEDILAAGE